METPLRLEIQFDNDNLDANARLMSAILCDASAWPGVERVIRRKDLILRKRSAIDPPLPSPAPLPTKDQPQSATEVDDDEGSIWQNLKQQGDDDLCSAASGEDGEANTLTRGGDDEEDSIWIKLLPDSLKKVLSIFGDYVKASNTKSPVKLKIDGREVEFSSKQEMTPELLESYVKILSKESDTKKVSQ
ncbi:hypothetical protein [Sessilibacter corallicola]|uniref:Uncharacterized protein n=1 Tax=Sessilibacter corallicola TaxID=2904075 RepID=A0ABQ0A4V5_9GAMM